MGAAGSALSRRVSEVVGVALFAAALLWLVALGSYEPGDPVWFFTTGTETPANFAGRVGAFLAELSFQLFGYVMSLAIGSVNAGPRSFRAGGYLGEFVADLLSEYLSRTGSVIVILTVLVAAIILSTQFSFGRLFGLIFHLIAGVVSAGWLTLKQWSQERRRARERRDVIAKHVKKGTAPEVVKAAVERSRAEPAAARTRIAAAAVDDEEREVGPRRAGPRASEETSAESKPAAAPPVVQKRTRTPVASPLPLPAPEPLSRGPAERRMSGYTLPPLSLLDPPKAERKVDERELMESARLLEEKCREFAVEGAVAQIHPGPVVTTFEFKPDAGVKYSKVTGLADDLCLAMQAESVLIERIPGKSTVGIQIPNPHREPISLRELLESDVYQRSVSKLTLALGKTIHGEPYMADLATMPHLLIAGSTGTGKSVGLNAMLTSVLFRATPDDVRMIMIDPKRLELGMYDEIPHLMTPVVVDPKKAANALRWAVREMEERYKTLAAFGVRNIEQYNRNIRQMIESKELPEGATEMPRPLAFIVVVVDELADLMMVAGNEVEESIARLAQMARAVGIHLILATQRPSVDVITGLIKANLPSRISFRVASKIDSRTILDSNGAEQLLGKGDMLLLPPASSQKVRLHGPYISEQESARLASFLRKQGKPTYDESITADDKKSGPESLEFEKDDLYDEAARTVVESGQVSISYLQRKLRIGFSRAARLVDMMEAEGLISPATGGKPREVLVGRDYFEEVDAQLR
jgi:DNA segregation ATPase FtsK/SpoIIIE, S-DNA-T family